MTEPPPADAPAADQATVQGQLDAILNDPSHVYNTGHHGYEAAEAVVLSLRRRLLAADNRPVVQYRDAEDPAPPQPAAGPTPIESPRPPGLDAPLVSALDAAMVREGFSTHTATMLLGVLDVERGQGTLTAWTEDTAGAYLVDRYGADAAEEYIADAQQAAGLLPAEVKAWLRSSGAHTNPTLIVEAAALWRRRSGKR